MNQREDALKSELESLVGLGKKILGRAVIMESSMFGTELADVTGWVVRSGRLIQRLYGEESQYYKSYSDALATKNFYVIHSNWNEHIAQVHGIVISIKHEFDEGLLFDIRALIQADVFSDFLEMGEYLLEEGYKDAAAVIIGAVLEDGLRTLAAKNAVLVLKGEGRPLTIEPLNIALKKKGVYNKLVQKQITSWAQVRNDAAHGKYSEYDIAQVKMMLLFVQSFAADYFSWKN